MHLKRDRQTCGFEAARPGQQSGAGSWRPPQPLLTRLPAPVSTAPSPPQLLVHPGLQPFPGLAAAAALPCCDLLPAAQAACANQGPLLVALGRPRRELEPRWTAVGLELCRLCRCGWGHGSYALSGWGYAGCVLHSDPAPRIHPGVPTRCLASTCQDVSDRHCPPCPPPDLQPMTRRFRTTPPSRPSTFWTLAQWATAKQARRGRGDGMGHRQ